MLARFAGIKKQACINRKCLLMVPRDEDGEKLARKRAKQRAIVPTISCPPALLDGDSASFLSGLNTIDDNGSNYLMESWICPPEELGDVMQASGFPGSSDDLLHRS